MSLFDLHGSTIKEAARPRDAARRCPTKPYYGLCAGARRGALWLLLVHDKVRRGHRDLATAEGTLLEMYLTARSAWAAAKILAELLRLRRENTLSANPATTRNQKIQLGVNTITKLPHFR